MPETGTRWLWYEKPAFVAAALILFWPLGLLLMWMQGKFTRTVRVAITVALPLLTVVAVALAVSGPGAATTPPPTADPAPATVTTSSTVPSTGTVSSAPTGSASATRTATGTSTSTTPTAPGKPSSKPAPVPTGPNASEARFTLKGSYKESGTVAFTLLAGQERGIAKYEWWVTALDRTTRYEGRSITDSYVGHPPDSILLVTTDTAGKTHASRANVTISGETMSAEAK